MSALLAQAQQMQQKLLETQKQLANAEVVGQAGGGLVKVVDPGDIETLQDLIVGAMGDASKQVTRMAQERLGALAGGMGGPPAQPPPPQTPPPTQLPGL